MTMPQQQARTPETDLFCLEFGAPVNHALVLVQGLLDKDDELVGLAAVDLGVPAHRNDGIQFRG